MSLVARDAFPSWSVERGPFTAFVAVGPQHDVVRPVEAVWVWEADAAAGRPMVFPLPGMGWWQFCAVAQLRGADDGPAGRGGWRYRRSATHVHRGIDLKAPVGHEVVSVEDGWAEYRAAIVNGGSRGWNTAGHRVRLTGRSGAGYQYFHLGTTHASTNDAFPAGVRSGDVVAVQAGQVLGYLGHTGGSAATGHQVPPGLAHLHFQFHPDGVDGEDANPARLFERLPLPIPPRPGGSTGVGGDPPFPHEYAPVVRAGGGTATCGHRACWPISEQGWTG